MSDKQWPTDPPSPSNLYHASIPLQPVSKAKSSASKKTAYERASKQLKVDLEYEHPHTRNAWLRRIRAEAARARKRGHKLGKWFARHHRLTYRKPAYFVAVCKRCCAVFFAEWDAESGTVAIVHDRKCRALPSKTKVVEKGGEIMVKGGPAIDPGYKRKFT